MMHTGLNIVIVANKEEILAKLRTNREKHRGIVIEARVGYFKKAREVLKEKMNELEQSVGKSDYMLQVVLQPPEDHTEDFDTAINTLKLHEESTIELTAEVIRMYVEDKWPWRQQFLCINSAYSESAQMMQGG